MGEKSRDSFNLGSNLDDKRWLEIFGEVEDQLEEDDEAMLEMLNRRLPPERRYKSMEEFWDQAWGHDECWGEEE